MKTNKSLIKIAETIYYGDFAIYRANNNWVAADTKLLDQNANRNGVTIYNESTAILYLCLSKQPASITAYSVQVAAGGTFILRHEDYKGEIRGIWSAANGAAMVTEFT